jgi:hypothetical protein
VDGGTPATASGLGCEASRSRSSDTSGTPDAGTLRQRSCAGTAKSRAHAAAAKLGRAHPDRESRVRDDDLLRSGRPDRVHRPDPPGDEMTTINAAEQAEPLDNEARAALREIGVIVRAHQILHARGIDSPTAKETLEAICEAQERRTTCLQLGS